MQALLLANLGAMHLVVHRPWEAEPFYKRALAMAEDKLGGEHPLVGRILSCYAVVLKKTNRKAEARQLARRARMILQAGSRADASRFIVDAGELPRPRRN